MQMSWLELLDELMKATNARKIAIFTDETETAMVMTNKNWKPETKKGKKK